MKRFAVPALVILALVALAIWGGLEKAPQQAAQPIKCTDPVAGCSFMHKGIPATLRFSAQPEALKPFILSIASPNLRKGGVSFQMVGMDMGFNRYDLRPAAGVWEATVTLPVCTIQRVDWIAELELDGEFYVVTFTTR